MIFIYALLIGILILCSWIMITLNEVDRTNQKLIHLVTVNQKLMDEKINNLRDENGRDS